MKKTTRVLLFFLIALFVLNTSFAGVDTYAEGEPWVEVSTASALQEEIDKAPLNDPKYIKLGASITNAGVISITQNQNVTIDLNGKILNLSDNFATDGLIDIQNSVVTICDNTIAKQELYEDPNEYANAGKITGGHSGQAGRHGGAISVSNGGNLTLDGGVISGSEAGYGGGVSVIQGSSFTMIKGCIDNNTVTREGAGVYIGGGEKGGSTFTMEGGFIRGNHIGVGTTVKINGGGVYVCNNSTFNMSGGQIGFWSQSEEIAGNSIDGYGGGVYVKNSTFNITGGTVTDNKAGKGGGGIYLDEGANFTMNSIEMTRNHADSGIGSAILVGKAALCNITGGKIYRNTAGDYYGAIYISSDCSGPVTINNVDIYDNYRGIYNEGKDVTLDAVNIHDNKCKNDTHGAGVYNDGNLKLIGENHICKNTNSAETLYENIYLTDGALLEIPEDLPEGTELGVWSDTATTKPVKITDGYGNKSNLNWKIQPEKYFFSDRDDYYAQKNPNDPTDHEVYLMQPKHTHSISNVSAEGDCITNGIKDHIVCTECGRFFDDTTGALEIEIYDVTADKNSSKHVGEAKYAKETIDVEPTCTKAGSKTLHYNCDKCNGEMKTEKVEIPALGHKFGPWTITKNPTKDADGVEERTCKVCGEKETRPVKYNGKDATEKANNVPTGDNSPVIPLALVMIFSLLNSICIMIIKKNTNN